MVQKVQTLFVDDIDGSAADGTVRFGLDRTDYEIDLNSDHAQALRDAPSPPFLPLAASPSPSCS